MTYIKTLNIFLENKNFFLFLFLFVCITPIHAQHLNKIEFDESIGQDVFLGQCSHDGIRGGVWEHIFDSIYQLYEPDTKVMQQLKQTVISEVSIIIVLGSWCGDSKEHVPAFMRILEGLSYPMSQLRIIAVNRAFQAGEIPITHFSVERVPTFIFYKNRKEIGRIIEHPQVTLEKDILEIMNVL
jgi:hypothetical protein